MPRSAVYLLLVIRRSGKVGLLEALSNIRLGDAPELPLKMACDWYLDKTADDPHGTSEIDVGRGHGGVRVAAVGDGERAGHPSEVGSELDEERLVDAIEKRTRGLQDHARKCSADVVAMTASAPMVPGRSRLDLAEANVAICRELVPRLVEVAPSAIFLFVTNPVDIVTYAALCQRQPKSDQLAASES